MSNGQLTPIGALARGALAGAAGTVAMDLVWYRRYRRGGGEDSLFDWEFSSGVENYEQAAAPAQVGRRVVGGFLDTELDPGTAKPMNNVVHWLTGVGWGTLHGALVGSLSDRSAAHGLATGVSAWASSYELLSRAKLYKPMREYPLPVLWKDLSAHLVFGLGTGTAFRLLAGRGGK